MKLILCEKDRQAQRIAEALGASETFNEQYPSVPIFTNDEIVITSLKGHLWNLTLPRKKLLYVDGNAQQQLPDLNTVYKENKKDDDRINLLRQLAAKEWKDIIIATDHDREGALIGSEALEHAFGITDLNKVKRAHFTSLESSEIIESFSNLVSFEEDRGFVEAGYCRSFLDAIWGINLTQYIQTLYRKAVIQGLNYDMKLFRKLPLATLSGGRVQSPTLSLINKHTTLAPGPSWHIPETEKESHDRQPQTFTQIHLHLDTGLFHLCTLGGDKSGIDKAMLVEVNETQKSIDCRKEPFNTDKIITFLAEKYGINPTQALWFLETLYTEGYITYPRTDSEKIPLEQERIDNILSNLSSIYDIASTLTGTRPREGQHEDEAHIAIIPTVKCTKDSLDNLKFSNPTNYVILDEIIKRFIMGFGKPTVKELKTYEFELEDEDTTHTFTSEAVTRVKFGEWANSDFLESIKHKVTIEDRTELDRMWEQSDGLLELEVSTSVYERQRLIPRRYFFDHEFIKEGSVVEEMSKQGLGTKATRPGIYGMLSDRKYITATPNMVLTTRIGNTILEFLAKHCPKLAHRRLTAELEQDLDSIVKETKSKEEVLEKGKNWLREIFDELFQKEDLIVQDILDNMPRCDRCGNIMVFKHYRGGTDSIFLGCVGYELENCNSIMSV